jgi:PEP-CTERM motif
VGDFFFMAAGAAPQFGVAIESHGGTVNGFNTGNTVSNTNLYAINNSSGVLKSDDVINKQPGDGITFNNGVNVWMRDIVIGGNHTITPEAGASVTPVSTPLVIGNGTTTPLYQISFTINRPGSSSDPFNKLIDSNGWAFQFESADCANDYFGGAVPEPATLSLMGLGFVALSLKSRTVRSTFRNLLRPRSN